MQPAPDLATALPPPEPVAQSAARSRRRWWIPVLGAFLAATGLLGGLWLAHEPASTWRTTPVVITDLRQEVSATGTLSAVTTVQVGTQVSGRVTELLVDFNDEVPAGAVIARIDPTLLEADVASSRAVLAQQLAARQLAHQELERVRFLVQRDAASTQELEAAESQGAAADARVLSARVALERAERNLGYATIVSPIDGVVVDRLVDVGQTVNAGMSAPTLYLLAGDLRQMEILATVDEADIGLVFPGQPAAFTVQAYSARSFEGRVDQVRLQSTTTDAVVTYTVVVAVDNPERVLLPGMTANVSFVVAEAHDVTAVPAAALRFRPPDTRQRGDAVWVMGEDGALRGLDVEVGLSDGSMIEIRGEGVVEGLSVATGIASQAGERSRASPFQTDQSPRSGPGRGPPGAF